jgi:hypothetical protein
MDSLKDFFLLGGLYADALQGFSGAAIRADKAFIIRS